MSEESERAHLGRVAGWHVRGGGSQLKGTDRWWAKESIWGREGSRTHRGASQHRSRRGCWLERCEAGKEAERKANDRDDSRPFTTIFLTQEVFLLELPP